MPYRFAKLVKDESRKKGAYSQMHYSDEFEIEKVIFRQKTTHCKFSLPAYQVIYYEI